MQLCCLCLLAIHMVQKNIAISRPILWHEYTEVFQNNFTEKYWLVVMGYNYSSEGIIAQKTLSVKYCAREPLAVLCADHKEYFCYCTCFIMTGFILWAYTHLKSSGSSWPNWSNITLKKKDMTWFFFVFFNMQSVFKFIKLSWYI